MSRKKLVTLDVRPDIRAGREPFGKIMQAISSLKEQEDLLLLAPFEPRPLYAVLAQRGFIHESKELPSGDWEVLFTQASKVEPGTASAGEASGSRTKGESKGQTDARAAGTGPATKACTGTPVLEVDARGLEPPQPLVKILEALAALPDGAQLRAHTERRPMHLYAHLEERGCVWDTAEQSDGSFITHVRRQ